MQTSRSQILKQATDYIQYMTKKNGSVQNEINELKRQNRILEQQGIVLWDCKILFALAFDHLFYCHLMGSISHNLECLKLYVHLEWKVMSIDISWLLNERFSSESIPKILKMILSFFVNFG